MTAPILLVDDNLHVLSGARLALEMSGFKVLTASSSVEALQTIENSQPAMIISDIKMNGTDGFTLLEQVRANLEWVTVPFLFMTAMDDDEAMQHARELGADDYLVKPISPGTLVQTVRARLERAQKLEHAHTSMAYLKASKILNQAMLSRDTNSAEHISRVAQYAGDLARALNLTDVEIRDIELSALLHDIGKMSVPEALLYNPSELDPEQWKVIKMHPSAGARMLSNSDLSPMVIEGVLYHHERYDGSGYPDGLAGENIPLAGRLLAVVDAFDAMTRNRPYRDNLSAVKALEVLRSCAGTQFDPRIVDEFCQLFGGSLI